MVKTKSAFAKKAKHKKIRSKQPHPLALSELFQDVELLGKLPSFTCHEPALASKFDDCPSSELQEIISDVSKELVARCCHLSADRWMQAAHGSLLSEDKDLAKAIQLGVANRRKGFKEAHRRFVEIDRREAINSMYALAQAVCFLTEWLEVLAGERPQLVKDVAKHFPEWPFNLGLKRVANKKGGIKCNLLRAATAKMVMARVEVGLEANNIVNINPLTDDGRSPFRIAAEQIYKQLCLIKTKPHHYLNSLVESVEADKKNLRPITKLPKWGKALFAGSLTIPMRSKNSSDWWRVAKLFLTDLWLENPGMFNFLAKSVNMAELMENKSGTVRNSIFLHYLKPAFIGLALK